MVTFTYVFSNLVFMWNNSFTISFCCKQDKSWDQTATAKNSGLSFPSFYVTKPPIFAYKSTRIYLFFLTNDFLVF
jgi:hypothetical protein